MKPGGHNWHPSRISGIEKQRRQRVSNANTSKRPNGKIQEKDIIHFK